MRGVTVLSELSEAPEGDPPPSRPENQSIGDWLFDALRESIVDGTLPAEYVLVEGTLAQRFGVSRGPAREALQRLQLLGLVRAMPRVGYIVTSVSLRDYDEVFTMRLGLEPISTELATKRIAAGIVDSTRLQDLANSHDSAINECEGVNEVSLARLNHAFHLEIARLSGNRRMERVTDNLLDDMQRVLIALAYSPDTLRSMWDDHPRLVRVMLAGEPASAREMMYQQLERAHLLMRELAVGSDLTISIDR